MSSLGRLRAVIAPALGVEHGEITPETKLSALGVDSLGALELMFLVENEFNVCLGARTYETVQDLVNSVEENMHGVPCTPCSEQSPGGLVL